MLAMSTSDALLHSLSQRIGEAHSRRSSLRIRGGGSKDFYTRDIQGDEVLDATQLSGIVAYEPSELVVTAGAGTSLVALEAALAACGQCLPFEPPHYAWSDPGASRATLGGMVASALSGPARASVGAVRDYVLGLRMINGQGQQLTFGGQVMKNVAGYDMSRLMVGALGTLGLITEVSLKVLPRAPAEATLVFALDQARALEQLHRWGGQPLPLNASCWVHDDAQGAAGGRDLLFVRLRGAVAAVDAACIRMLADVPGQRVDPEQAGADWERCRNQQLPFFQRPANPELALWRLSLPPTAPALELPWRQLVEWHGALRWLWAPVGARATLEAALLAAGAEIENASIFVAPSQGSVLAAARLESKNPAQAGINRRLKASFDPHGVFNPGLSPALPIHANPAQS